jgi:S1-C subfamily serine protease
MVPSLPISGEDLSSSERKQLGMTDKQLAFRSIRLKPTATDAGFVVGDIIVAIDGRTPEMSVAEFRSHIRHEFLVGDRITLTVLRGGTKLEIPLSLRTQ